MAHETNRANAPGLSWKFTCQTFSESRTTLSSSSNEPIIGSDARQVSARKASHFGWCPSDSCFSGMLITTMALCIGECLQKRSVFGVRSDCGLLIHGSAVSSILVCHLPKSAKQMLVVEFADLEIGSAAERYRPSVAKYLPKPLRALYRGGRARQSMGSPAAMPPSMKSKGNATKKVISAIRSHFVSCSLRRYRRRP